MRLPNFLIIGAAKSGTTALYRQLCEHSQVFMSRLKEPGTLVLEGHSLNFFGPGDNDHIGHCSVNSFEEYASLFEESEGAKAVGEASNIYLYHPSAAAAIKERLPKAKLIAMLRNPADRAYSAYSMMVRDGRERGPFREAVEQSERRAEAGWSYVWDLRGGGLYAKQLKRYLALFPREQILVLLFDDYQRNPKRVLKRICDFIGVRPSTLPPLKANVSRDPDKWLLVHSQRVSGLVNNDSVMRGIARTVVPTNIRRGVARLIRRMNMRVPEMENETRRQLVEFYRDDVAELERLTGYDLRSWMH